MRMFITLLCITFFFSFSLIRAQIPDYVPSSGLVGWWPFNGNANDESGNGLNGQVNGPKLTVDRYGNPESAYAFTGLNDNIIIDTTFFNNGWDSLTFSCWVSLDELFNTKSINSNHLFVNTIPHHGLGIGYNWRNSNRCDVSIGNGQPASNWNTNLFNALGLQPFQKHKWTMITLVKKGSLFRLYIDGVNENSIEINQNIKSHFYKLVFGNCDQSICSEVLSGKIDDIGVWNRALDSNHIVNLYKGVSAACSYSIKQTDTTICQGTVLELNAEIDTVSVSIPKDGLVGWWPFNGNANDESGNGNHGIVDKATLTLDKNNIPNSAYLFNSQGSKITIPDAQMLNNKTLSVSFWMKSSNDTNLKNFIYKTDLNTANHELYAIISPSSGILEFCVKNGSNCEPGKGWSRNKVTQSISDNLWHHVTATFDGIFSKIYIDTVLASEIQQPFFPIDSCPGGTILFGQGWNNDANLDGILDDIAIWNRAISHAEVKTMYKLNRPKSAPSIPTDGLVGYWPFDGNAKDQTSFENHGTVKGATLTTDRCQNRNAAYEFNGIDNFIEVANSQSLSDVESITMSAWILLDSMRYQHQGICTKWWQGVNCTKNSDTYTMAINNHPQTNYQTKLVCGTNNYSNYDLQTTNPIPETEWVHLMFVHNSSTGGKLYVNSVLAGTTGISGSICQSTNPILIGADNNQGSYWRFFDGKIDDIAIWNRPLSDSEVTQVYNAGSCNCTDTLPEDNFTWSTGQKGRKITVAPNASTMYTLEVARGKIIDRDTIHVTVLESPTPDIFGHVKVYERQINYSYYTPFNDSSTYEWSISGNGKLSSTNGGSSILVDFKEPGYAYLTVTETNKYGCKRDTTITIRIYRMTDIADSEIDSEELNIYPNPMNEFGSVMVKAFIPPSTRASVSIVDMLGKNLITSELDGQNAYREIHVPISTESLINGIYMIQLRIDGNIISKKLIINR